METLPGLEGAGPSTETQSTDWDGLRYYVQEALPGTVQDELPIEEVA
ncbi:hypothetical protein HG434_000275 [Candidatus Saccharibacteria bacterium]|jgi:hypothetical protein|nr:hypothetical protein [Candidatus Saccharibacteria bacterium]